MSNWKYNFSTPARPQFNKRSYHLRLVDISFSGSSILSSPQTIKWTFRPSASGMSIWQAKEQFIPFAIDRSCVDHHYTFIHRDL